MAEPEVPPDSVILSQFDGLKNTVAPERLTPKELEVALNVDLDDTGQLRRRRGYNLASAGDFHSLFETTSRVLGVKNGVLGIINPDFSFQSYGITVGSSPVAYVQVGDDVYLSSGSLAKIIRGNGSVVDWGTRDTDRWVSPVVNPTTTLGEVRGKLLAAPPVAQHLAYHNGRIYLAADRVLWATELYLYNYVDKTRTFLQFEADIVALGTVSDGIYVGTTAGTYFLSGVFPLKRVKVDDSPVVPGSMIGVDADLVNLQPGQTTKASIMFMTGNGLVTGLDQGVLYNLTNTKFLFPSAQNMAALFRQQDGVNQYVGVADHGGTPSSSARIGDYVDAEIRRFQGA